jgi:Histidine kinase-, DNA gyrase B-, and HSP90-like ATPase
MAPLEGFEMESNVARDVLSTASSFGSLPKVIAEYVTNSIDARVNGHQVSVSITKRRYGGATRVIITDDASGMDEEDLRRFFYMHAENEARRRGRRTRGRFGTGKAAAFGIGTSLQVETRRDGRHWIVRLEKNELEAAVTENRKPQPGVLVDGEPTTEGNGTSIIIEGIGRQVDERRIADELRKRLGRQLDVHTVTLFNSRVVTVEPRAAREWAPFRSAGHPVAAVIGDDVVCEIKASSTTVDDAIRGVVVTANDFPVAQIEGAGDHGARIFGHCEVPALEADDSTPGPYTDARDLTLNEDNPTAGPLAAWIRECLATAIAELAAEERERRRRARDDALRNAASKMEAVLNRHYQGEFRRTRSRAGDLGTQITDVTIDADGELVQPNPDGVAGYTVEPGQRGDGGEPPTETEPTEREDSRSHPLEHDPLGEGRGDSATTEEDRPRRRRSGGFKIDWENAGVEAPRSKYIESELTILINLDHPQVAAAYSAGDASPLFRMLVFEAAAQEYCYATAYQQLEDDQMMDASDILQYVRTTIDLLTRNIADVVADLNWLTTPATP